MFRIIDGCLDQEDLCQAIVEAFNTEKGIQILHESSSPAKSERIKNIIEDNKKTEKNQRHFNEQNIDKKSEFELRRMQIEAEIERIRRAANS